MTETADPSGYPTEPLAWADVSGFFRDHGCVVSGMPELRWYREAWDALGAAGLQTKTVYRCSTYGQVALRLRAITLMAIYLGIYQFAADSELDGYFSEHAPLSWYLDGLGVDWDALSKMAKEWLAEPIEADDDDDAWLYEAVVEMVREENDAVFQALEQHFGGEIGLFVALWNSRREAQHSESVEEAVNAVSPGDGKVEVWSYVQGGMRDWWF